MAAMEAILREGLAQGAVAMGFGSAYTPGAPMAEIERMFRVAAEGGVSAHIHMRGGLAGTAARRSRRRRPRARRSTSCTSTRRPATSIDEFLAAIQAARDAGQDVTTEAYPYGAGMTEIQSALFDDWATLARRALCAAPARVHRRAPHAGDVREGAEDRRHGDHPRAIRGADARRDCQPARDDRQRRLHRERPRTSAHVGHVRQGARPLRARRAVR